MVDGAMVRRPRIHTRLPMCAACSQTASRHRVSRMVDEAMAVASLPVFLIHFEAPEWCSSATSTLLASDTPVTVTVVNNGGRLDLDADVSVVDTDRNRGYAGGANTALRQWLRTDVPYCIIGSHDLHVEPDTLRLLVEAADRAPSFGILGPCTTTNWAGGLVDGSEPGIEARKTMSGTCLLFRRECVRQIGLFDPTFRSYGEDDEICHRAWAHGWKVGRVVAARADGRGTRGSRYRQVNTLANRPLLELRRKGLKAGFMRYWAEARRLPSSMAGRTQLGVPKRVYARALFVGFGRLWMGAVRRPPRAPQAVPPSGRGPYRRPLLPRRGN